MNSGIIDYNSFIMIIKKIELYKDTEEKLIININKSLGLLSSYYSGNNSKNIKNKINSLNIALNTLLSNRNSYIDYLTRIVNIYIDTNKENESIYNNYNIN